MTLTEGIQTLMSIQKYQRFSILDNVSKASYMYRCRLKTFLRLLSLKKNKWRWKLKKKWIIKKLHIVCNKVVVWNVQFTFTPWCFFFKYWFNLCPLFLENLSRRSGTVLTQSSTYENYNTARAHDGSLLTTEEYCAITDTKSNIAWLQVDLWKLFSIKNVRIFYRKQGEIKPIKNTQLISLSRCDHENFLWECTSKDGFNYSLVINEK